MAETDIERHNWAEFLNDFCRKHETWLADVDAFQFPAGQPDQVARDLHIRGIEVSSDGEQIRLVLRRSESQDFVHTVFRPSRVTHIDPRDGRGEELQIQGANTATVIRFHSGAQHHLRDEA
ncbi:MAG TPA: DUF5335 family protein [Bryobacteraceae bacterium]|nr:DUF5335 family protein [Bryobacteraceae bacterium]